MDDLKLLKTTNDNYEYNLIIDLLNNNRIPYIIKNDSLGGHMKIVSGSNIYGTTIYIRDKDLDKAKELLKVYDLSHQ